MDVAWIGIIGTAVGALIGGGIGVVGARLKWKREQRIRYSDQRIEAYAEMMTAAAEYCVYIPSATSQELVDARFRFLYALEVVEILATTPVMRAATAHGEALNEYCGNPASEDSSMACAITRRAFYTAAKKELGVG